MPRYRFRGAVIFSGSAYIDADNLEAALDRAGDRDFDDYDYNDDDSEFDWDCDIENYDIEGLDYD
jgi:hypothetical protein